MGSDIKLQIIGSSKNYTRFFKDNLNTTSYSIAFWTTYWDDDILNLPCSLEHNKDEEFNFFFYSLMFNSTLVSESLIQNYTENIIHDSNLLRIKQGIDSGIMSYLSSKKGLNYTPEINISSSYYPAPVDRFVNGMNITAFMGSYWFNLPCLITFLVIVILIIEEKELKLRQGLNVIGVSHSLYWVHWIVTALFLSIFSSLIQVISWLIFKNEMFVNSNFIIMISFFILYNISMSIWGFCLWTLMPSRNTAYGMWYAIVLISLSIQFAFSNDTLILFLFFSVEASPIIKTIKLLLQMYPPFTYSILFMQIMRVASTHFNSNHQAFEEGRIFSWSELLFEERDFLVIQVEYHVSSALTSFGYLLIDILLYSLLTWYFDHIITKNRGVVYSKFFWLTAKYWTKKCWKSKRARYQAYFSQISEDSFDNDEMSEATVAISLKGIMKTFKFRTWDKTWVHYCQAVKPTAFKIYENELFWILGHNGAGKSTLINMLVGILPPTKNTASIFGFDIVEEIEEARKFIGVIPQFDILWNDLTVFQNMEIICYLKGVDPYVIIKETLEAVQLYDWSNIQVCQLSGGMRRRVSFAISMIGNPKVIFMDEPTSGMDPIVRRQVWNIIREIK